VGLRFSAPGPQEKRYAAYREGLAQAAEHQDRQEPLKKYVMGLLLEGERQSIEPMAARLDAKNTQAVRQSLQHFVANAPGSDEAILEPVRNQVWPSILKQGPMVAWIVDDTGFPKKGKHSVGVARQYCGQVGQPDNCQVAVSLSVATWEASLPIAYRLYLPQEWAKDSERREKAGVPEQIRFQTKPPIAVDQIRPAVQADLVGGVVLRDAAYGNDSQFRAGVTDLGLTYMVGVQSSMSGWKNGTAPLPPKLWKGQGRPPQLLRRDREHQPVSVQELALGLPASAWKNVTWRQGTDRKLKSRFAAVRVRPAHRDDEKAELAPEEWLVVEWPKGEAEPVKYWLSTLSTKTKLKELAKMAKHRWIIERDYEELKQELGLGH